MKTIRLGNDVQINWYITRFGKPEDFTGKNLTVKLIDKIGNEQVFDYEIEGNRITGIFYGKDQSTNGVYRLLLVENDGKEDMVSLDYIDAFCLSNKMKNQTSNGSDTTSTINTEVEEYESKIDLEQDLFYYAKKTYVNEKIDEVNKRIDSLPVAYTKEEADERFTTRKDIDDAFYNKQEIDNNIYTKGQVDKIISEIPKVDTYTKSEIDAKIDDVSNNIPTRTSDLTNDSGFATEKWVENKHYLVANDIAGKADKSEIPTKTSELTNDSGFVAANVLADVAKSGSYNDLTDKPVIPSLDGYATEQWVENKHYLVANDVSTFVDASTVYTKVQVESKLVLKADKSEIPTKTSQLTNDSGFVRDSILSPVSTSGSYNDLTDKPTIPAAPVQSDWNESDNSNLAFINNKPTIPTKTSQLTNDSGFVRGSALSPVSTSGSYNDLTDKPTIPSADNFEAKAWRGTQAEYDALTVIEQNRIYIILPTT